jgi:NAD(P)-dependent dehydrogenase (short-subunit alcohol dehydrogenase family)
MGTRLKGRNAVVAGGGRGIGKEVALGLAAEGANVVVNGVTTRPEEGHELAPADEVVAEINKLGGTAIVNHDNVADFTAAGKLIQSCVDAFGRIDILVNSAGVIRDRMIHKMSEEEWDTVLNVHLKGTFNTCRHATPLMREQKYGRIVNPCSVALRGSVGQANYSSAKGGIASLTRTIAMELGRHGVTCNALVPMAATRITANEEVLAKWKRQYDEGTISKQVYEERSNMPGPEFCAPIVVYLCSEEAANVNGLLFRSAGGTVGIYSEPELIKTMHKDHRKGEVWSFDELEELVPKILLVNYVNPAPPEVK